MQLFQEILYGQDVYAVKIIRSFACVNANHLIYMDSAGFAAPFNPERLFNWGALCGELISSVPFFLYHLPHYSVIREIRVQKYFSAPMVN